MMVCLHYTVCRHLLEVLAPVVCVVVVVKLSLTFATIMEIDVVTSPVWPQNGFGKLPTYNG